MRAIYALIALSAEIKRCGVIHLNPYQTSEEFLKRHFGDNCTMTKGTLLWSETWYLYSYNKKLDGCPITVVSTPNDKIYLYKIDEDE